ncbi:hypothetical protein [Salibacter halophilus]|uniref:DUF4856 domain-containing protein n=1 Tax=Salibacter halophilus TaxID=1803916 RepID=A0A6N6M999_9FLAO|nr:hypothetical protein [Salibacter halophilus]KAB1065555.1 hypothetical protein F3059_02570 [Salibacter halophilus]
MNFPKLLSIILILTVSLFSCNKDDNNTSVNTIPNNYQSNDFDSNAFSQIKLGNQLEALVSRIGEGDEGLKVEQADVDSLFNYKLSIGGSIFYTDFVEKEVLPLIGSESGNQWDLVNNPKGGGGVFGGHLLSYTGFKHRELIEKAYYMSGHYLQAYKIAYNPSFSSADVDKLLALFGTTPAFPMGSHNAQVKDRFSAKYTARRTPVRGGFYLDIRKALIFTKHYMEHGYSAESDEVRDQLEVLFTVWEKSIAASAIHNMYATLDLLAKSNPTQKQLADALSTHSKSVAFILGSQQLLIDRYIMAKDEDLEAVLSLLMFNDLDYSNSNAYLLASDHEKHQQDIVLVINLLQNIYDFSDGEMDSFKVNWVEEENRLF